MPPPIDHPAIPAPRIGVLLTNLGTPDAPDAASVKRYLAEFLSDRRVVEIPSIIWQPILRGIILNTRPKKSAHAYSQVWTEEGSPLAAITARQAKGLQARLGDAVMVDFAMRYGNPAHRRDNRPDERCRLRTDFAGTALSAILRRHDRHRQRCRLRDAGHDALAARAAHAAAIS